MPQTASSMEFNSLNDFTYNPAFDSSSPPRSYSPMESAGVAPQALTYSLTPGELSSDAMIPGRISRDSNSRSPPAVPYAATVPRSHRYNQLLCHQIGPARARLTSGGRAGATTNLMTRTTRNSNLDLLLATTTLLLVTRKPPILCNQTNLILLSLGAAKLFANNASSPSNADAMSSGKGTLVSKSPSPPRTRRLAKFPSSNEVRLVSHVKNSSY